MINFNSIILGICLILILPCELKAQYKRQISIEYTQSRNNFNLDELFPNIMVPESFEGKKFSHQFGLRLYNEKGAKYYSVGMATRIISKSISKFEEGVQGSESSDRSDVFFLDSHIRFEKGYLANFSNIKKLQSGIGVSIDPRYTFKYSISNFLTDFPLRLHTLGASMNIIPSIKYNISRRTSIVLKTPIQLLSFDFLHLKTKNPSTPLVDQVGWNTQLELGTFLFTINAGFAFTLGKNKK